MFMCNTCQQQFNSKEELIEHVINKHTVEIKEDSEINELRQKLKEQFGEYNIEIKSNSRHWGNHRYNIFLTKDNITIQQLYLFKSNKGMDNNITVPQNLNELVELINKKIDFIKQLEEVKDSYNIKEFAHVDLDYGNLECDLYLTMDIITQDDEFYHTGVKVEDALMFLNHIGEDYFRFKNELHKYNVTELEGYWELEDPYYMITPNLMINNISVEVLLHTAKKLGKKVKLSIVD